MTDHSGDPTTIDEDGFVTCAACGARASYLQGGPWYSAEDGSEVEECPVATERAEQEREAAMAEEIYQEMLGDPESVATTEAF